MPVSRDTTSATDSTVTSSVSARLALPRLHLLVDGFLLRVDLLLELLRFVEALARRGVVLLALQLRDLRFAFLDVDRARGRADPHARGGLSIRSIALSGRKRDVM